MLSYQVPWVHFHSFSVLLTISPKYLNELISTLDLLLWCTKWNEWSVFLSFQLLNLIITQGTRKISNDNLKKALLDHLSKSSTGLPYPPIKYESDLHYCSSSVHYCEYRFHIHVFIHSSHIRLSPNFFSEGTVTNLAI